MSQSIKKQAKQALRDQRTHERALALIEKASQYLREQLQADIDAASLPSGYSPVRGTSFAAPIVASRLALRLERPDRAAAERAVSELVTAAVDLGRPGRDSVYGNGCVGCATRDVAVEAARAR